ncbi:hypothetical protein NM688_g3274 [Phlebia brevispora]|uniref:Uncharacterized protein n=1 Tax=Phlebia brevispora TaxID=194682 RepID=A0ACC1T630_9APHY|nr:hypothetical protein NM688_g3274 [Phlebia brevispora]
MGQAAEIYAEQLNSLSLGHPLWFPDPTAEGEVQIGDVGYIHDGRFRRLFNITRGRDHRWNFRGVPEGFEPLDAIGGMRLNDRNFLSPGVLGSSSMRTTLVTPSVMMNINAVAQCGISCGFECSGQHGALLALKSSAACDTIDRSLKLEKYIRRNHRAWHTFARETLGLNCRPEELVCISGCIKTSEWTVAAFLKDESSHGAMIRGQLGPVASVGCEVQITQSREMAARHHSGPVRPRAARPVVAAEGSRIPVPTPTVVDHAQENDQTVFIHYYKVKYRRLYPRVPKVIKAAAGPHRLPDPERRPESDGIPAGECDSEDDDEDDDVEIEATPSRHHPNSPLDSLLEYLLESTDAEVALASHDHLYSFLKGASPSELTVLLRSSPPSVRVEQGMAVLADKRDRQTGLTGSENDDTHFDASHSGCASASQRRDSLHRLGGSRETEGAAGPGRLATNLASGPVFSANKPATSPGAEMRHPELRLELPRVRSEEAWRPDEMHQAPSSDDPGRGFYGPLPDSPGLYGCRSPTDSPRDHFYVAGRSRMVEGAAAPEQPLPIPSSVRKPKNSDILPGDAKGMPALDTSTQPPRSSRKSNDGPAVQRPSWRTVQRKRRPRGSISTLKSGFPANVLTSSMSTYRPPSPPVWSASSIGPSRRVGVEDEIESHSWADDSDDESLKFPPVSLTPLDTRSPGLFGPRSPRGSPQDSSPVMGGGKTVLVESAADAERRLASKQAFSADEVTQHERLGDFFSKMLKQPQTPVVEASVRASEHSEQDPKILPTSRAEEVHDQKAPDGETVRQLDDDAMDSYQVDMNKQLALAAMFVVTVAMFLVALYGSGDDGKQISPGQPLHGTLDTSSVRQHEAVPSGARSHVTLVAVPWCLSFVIGLVSTVSALTSSACLLGYRSADLRNPVPRDLKAILQQTILISLSTILLLLELALIFFFTGVASAIARTPPYAIFPSYPPIHTVLQLLPVVLPSTIRLSVCFNDLPLHQPTFPLALDAGRVICRIWLKSNTRSGSRFPAYIGYRLE